MLVHLALSVPAIILSFVISVPLGWLAHRYRWSRGVLLSLCGAALRDPVARPVRRAARRSPGSSLRSPLNLVIALTLYGIAVMVRTAADAFDSVERRRAPVGDGGRVLDGRQRFWGVELPLAGPVLLSGLRVVIVSTVSLATVGAVIGVPSLGNLFTDGFQRGIQAEIFTGIVATIVLALVLDWARVLIGRLLHAVVATERRARAAARSHGVERADARMNLFLDGIAWILDPANWTGVGSIPERIGAAPRDLGDRARASPRSSPFPIGVLRRPHRARQGRRGDGLRGARALPTLGVLTLFALWLGDRPAGAGHRARDPRDPAAARRRVRRPRVGRPAHDRRRARDGHARGPDRRQGRAAARPAAPRRRHPLGDAAGRRDGDARRVRRPSAASAGTSSRASRPATTPRCSAARSS